MSTRYENVNCEPPIPLIANMVYFPTVSVLLYGYNSAKYVERTVASLLAQDYPHLEYYFSDDGSTDRSFEIMETLVAASTRPVILHRNPTNLGICNQVNAGVARTTGPLVMLANADDIYPSDYVSRLVRAWAQTTPRPTMVWAQLQHIDEADRPTGVIGMQRTSGTSLSERVRGRAGSACATGAIYDRRVFSDFGPLPDNLMLEDSCLNARAFILGDGLQISEPLVKYRVHEDNISQVYSGGEYSQWHKRRQSRAIWHSSQGHRAFVEMLRDLHQRPAGSADPLEVRRARWIAVEKVIETALWRDHYTDDRTLTSWQRWAIIARVAVLNLKLTLRKWIPYLDERSARWEYRSYMRARP